MENIFITLQNKGIGISRTQ